MSVPFRNIMKRKSLTLMEVLVATAVFSFLSVALYSLLRVGLSVRDKIESKQGVFQSAYMNLEKMAQELRNVVFFKEGNAGFKGYEEEDKNKVKIKILEFFSVIFNYQQDRPEVVKITYRFNPDARTLTKEICNPFDEQSLKKFVFLEHLEKLEFYYFFEGLSKAEGTGDTKDKLPEAVKIELTYKDDSEKQYFSLNKHVFIYRYAEKI